MAAKKKRKRTAPAAARRRSDAQLLRARWLTPAECVRRRELEEKPISKQQLYATYIGGDAKYREQVPEKDGRYDFPLLSEVIDLVQSKAAGEHPEEVEEALRLKLIAESRLKQAEARIRERRDAQEAGQVVFKEQIYPPIISIFTRLKSRLEQLPGAVSESLAGLEAFEVQASLEDVVHDLLSEIDSELEALKDD